MKNITPIISLIMVSLLLLIPTGVQAQVGIGTVTPHTNAILDIVSTSGGILIPRMTVQQKNDIASPVEGLLIYQEDASVGFFVYTSGAWQALADKDWTMHNNGTDMYNVNTGNVGIGTIAPTKKLHIEDIDDSPLRIVDGDQAMGKVIISDANGNATWQTITSDNISDVSNILAFQGLVIPSCYQNIVGSTGDFTIPINGVSTTVTWTILKRQITQATTENDNLISPLLAEGLQVKYDFNPNLPYTPSGIVLVANNNSSESDTFTLNYAQKSASSITVNIVRCDVLGYHSLPVAGPCWYNVYSFDVMMTE